MLKHEENKKYNMADIMNKSNQGNENNMIDVSNEEVEVSTEELEEAIISIEGDNKNVMKTIKKYIASKAEIKKNQEYPELKEPTISKEDQENDQKWMKFQNEYREFLDKEEECKRDSKRAYETIIEQCSESIIERVKELKEFQEIARKQDLIALMKVLRQLKVIEDCSDEKNHKGKTDHELIKEKYDFTMNSKNNKHQRSDDDDNNNKWDHMMESGPERLEVEMCKTEPHNLKNFDVFRTKGVDSETNNKEQSNESKNNTENDNSELRESVTNDIKVKNGNRRKRIDDQAEKHKVTENAPNYEFLNLNADQRNGLSGHANSGKTTKKG